MRQRIGQENDGGLIQEPHIESCPRHNVLPLINKAKHGLWVAYCPEPHCGHTQAHEEKHEAIEAWNKKRI